MNEWIMPIGIGVFFLIMVILFLRDLHKVRKSLLKTKENLRNIDETLTSISQDLDTINGVLGKEKENEN